MDSSLDYKTVSKVAIRDMTNSLEYLSPAPYRLDNKRVRALNKLLGLHSINKKK